MVLVGENKVSFGIGGGGGGGVNGGALGLATSLRSNADGWLDVLLLKRLSKTFISSSRVLRTLAVIWDSEMVDVFDSSAAIVCWMPLPEAFESA